MRTIPQTRAMNLLQDPADLKGQVEATKAAILAMANSEQSRFVHISDAVKLKENGQLALFFESCAMYAQALDFYTDVLRRLQCSNIQNPGELL